MDYQCQPDLEPTSDLTVDAVGLFQRFRQEPDTKLVEALLDQELARQIKLCELAIVCSARVGYYWCELPKHPLEQIEVMVFRHLAKMGFQIEQHSTATDVTVPYRHDCKKTVTTTVVKSYSTAGWLTAKPLDQQATAAEWLRREAREQEDLKNNPPHRRSSGSGKDLAAGDAVWAAVLDGRFVIEVHELNHGACLCIFDRDGKCVHVESTGLSFGAMFGADMLDVAGWRSRAQQVVDSWQASQHPIHEST